MSNILFQWGRELPVGLVVFLATFLIWFLAAGVFYSGWRLPAKRNIFFIKVVAAITLVLVVNILIGLFYWRARPFVSYHFLPLISLLWENKSFPSDHAGVSWALAALTARFNKKNSWLFFLAALLISLGRVLSGVHYASDIVVGAGIGLLAAWLINLSDFFFVSRCQQK